MKTVVQKEPLSQVRLTVTLDAADLLSYEDLALKRLGEKVKIKGFRPGKVPLPVLRQKISPEALRAEILDVALPQSYAAAVEEEKLEVISRPQVEFKSSENEEEMAYEALMAVMPLVEVGDLSTIKVSELAISVTDQDVDKVLEEVRKKHTIYRDGDESAVVEDGDRVELDFEGTDEGGAILEGTSSKNHPVIVGSKSLVPGFEENISGLKKGEKKEFAVVFPADYFQASFQKKKVNFKVEVKLIQKAEKPEFTPEFLRQVTGKDLALADLRAEIRQGLEDQKKFEDQKRREVEFFDAVVGMTKLEIPPQLEEEEIDYMIRDLKADLGKKGLKYEDYLTYLKKTEEQHRGEYGDEAKRRIALRFALKTVYERENITVGSEELAAAVEEIVSYYPPNEQAKVRSVYGNPREALAKQLLNKLKIDKVLAKYLS